MFGVGKVRLPEVKPHLMERESSVDCNLKERLAVVFLVTVLLLRLVHLRSSVHIFSELCYYVLPVREIKSKSVLCEAIVIKEVPACL